ncbi:MAG: hypothetical protein ABI858_03985, partial [Pseudoxanthomonas sp.]
KSGCVRIHRAAPQPKDAATDRQRRFEVSHPFTTIRDFGVEPIRIEGKVALFDARSPVRD